MSYTERALARDDKEFVPPAPSVAESEDANEKLVLDTRFGRIEIDPASVMTFKSGLLGFSDAREFALIELDNEKYAQFRVLQCITDPTLSFIVFPPSLDNGLIDRADIEAAGKAVGIPFENLVVLLLVTVRRQQEGNSLSVNLRAPVLINPVALEGVQYVLPSEKYPVRFNLQ